MSSDARRTAEDRLREHELKVWPDYFDALETGAKTFEVRLNDRDFRNGDTLWLREWNQGVGYTGRSIRRTVTNILRGPAFGIEDKYVCMALRAAPASAPPETEAARNILAEMIAAAKDDGVTFDEEQIGFVNQALYDMFLETAHQRASGHYGPWRPDYRALCRVKAE